MKKQLLFIFFMLLGKSVFCNDTLTLETFAFMNGNWKGSLTYTDYQNDTAQTRLQTYVSFALQNGVLAEHYTYIEPDGSPVFSQSTISLTNKKDKFRMGEGAFKAVESSPNYLLLTCEGEDNNRKATIQKKIQWDKNHLTITKLVRYEGTNTFFIRHTYRLEPETDEETQERLLKAALGKWTIDLRPSASAEPYYKDFILKDFSSKSLSGIFYDTPFQNGKIHTEWGKLYFSFTTNDNSGTYFHSGYVEKGVIHGTSFSENRGFIMPWSGIKQ
ncbi:MAG: hypothetical protein U5L45_23165 [Saprospiraceae bacterium]|nr:hypothetical protein [Saprospiraceae bacterium]